MEYEIRLLQKSTQTEVYQVDSPVLHSAKRLLIGDVIH